LPWGGGYYGACKCLALGCFSGAVTDGKWGRDIYGQELARPLTKGMNASRPTTISQPGKVTWRAWPAINPVEPMEYASDCNPSFSPRRCGFVSHPGSIGWWMEGVVFPPCGRLLLLMGLLIQVVPVAAQTRGPGFWGAVRAPGVHGCWGAVPCGVSPSPLLRWSFAGFVFSCSGETC
jgi:hypothetical protein